MSSIILYYFQVYSIVLNHIKYSPRYFQPPAGTVHSYYNITDWTPYVVLYIPVQTQV